jgi:hypothetical protein
MTPAAGKGCLPAQATGPMAPHLGRQHHGSTFAKPEFGPYTAA